MANDLSLFFYFYGCVYKQPVSVVEVSLELVLCHIPRNIHSSIIGEYKRNVYRVGIQ